MAKPAKEPFRDYPTFTNIYGQDVNKKEFFSDIPFYATYLHAVCQLFEMPRRHILDIGCGRGEYGEIIMREWGHEVETYTGIDLDQALVERLGNPQIRHGDLLSFKSRRKYDVVLCHSVLQYLPSPNTAFKKLRQLVKKDGLVSIFQTMTREDYELYRRQAKWQDPYAWQHTIAAYRKAMFKYFDVISYGLLIPKGSKSKDPYTIDKLFLFDK